MCCACSWTAAELVGHVHSLALRCVAAAMSGALPDAAQVMSCCGGVGTVGSLPSLCSKSPRFSAACGCSCISSRPLRLTGEGPLQRPPFHFSTLVISRETSSDGCFGMPCLAVPGAQHARCSGLLVNRAGTNGAPAVHPQHMWTIAPLLPHLHPRSSVKWRAQAAVCLARDRAAAITHARHQRVPPSVTRLAT